MTMCSRAALLHDKVNHLSTNPTTMEFKRFSLFLQYLSYSTNLEKAVNLPNESQPSVQQPPPPPTQTTSTKAVLEDVASRHDSIVAIDCEMVGVWKMQPAAASCSIVGYNGEVLYHSYIKPSKLITAYRTRWSGIKPYHMKFAVTEKQALKWIRSILKHKIIVGHDLKCDFRVLGITDHPDILLRDTMKCPVIHRLTGKKQPSLKFLSSKLLEKEIQKGPHSSLEDAMAVMNVYKVVEYEWEELLRSQQTKYQ
ncbi:interferon-stimulated gene 20 kDa protein-like isoform X2 [Dysidea avara]|uniref:interferon-stimulated gene 20 kDa protein-like isoform X2 n=1 Tax=Dysidea avara TaxID=196820 RepID=UPI0033165D66